MSKIGFRVLLKTVARVLINWEQSKALVDNLVNTGINENSEDGKGRLAQTQGGRRGVRPRSMRRRHGNAYWPLDRATCHLGPH